MKKLSLGYSPCPNDTFILLCPGPKKSQEQPGIF